MDKELQTSEIREAFLETLSGFFIITVIFGMIALALDILFHAT